jgi:arylsulfatase A-like enzyme
MSTRPNILWFSIEDTGPRFGCYGNHAARTPNLDRLASEGCRYTRAFSVAGVCAPSRAAIITGMYPTFIGAHHMRTSHTSPYALPTPYSVVPPHYVKTFTEYLRSAGYFCTNNSKTDYQFDPPFTAWDELSEQAHWRHRKSGQPFFAVFNPTASHESGMWKDPNRKLITDPQKVTVPPFLPDTPEVRSTIAQHYDNLEIADNMLGQLLAELKADGLLENTIIVVWSDHGEGLPRAKRWPYDSGINIPLIVRWPGKVKAGSVEDRLVSLIDLGPTMLSICGIPVPAHLQGQAFLGTQAQPPREHIFATRDRYDEAYDMIRAVRDRRFKYIRNYYPNVPYQLWIPYSYKHGAMQEIWRLHLEGDPSDASQRLMQTQRPPEELYDLEADPFELKNVAGESHFAGDLQRLRRVLDEWRRDYDVYGDISELEMVHRWWPGGKQPVTDAPIFVVVGKDHLQPVVRNGGGVFKGPILIQMHCATQGAAIGYTFESGEKFHWQLYNAPLRLESGSRVTLRAKAARIGYKESRENAGTFVIE